MPNSSSTESYVQQYNIRGHAENPVSRQAARRLRRAQNDVLSTIGVCVSIDENGEIKSNLNPANPRARAEKKITQATASENESGYHATTYDEILYKLATGWTYNLRRRLMVLIPNYVCKSRLTQCRPDVQLLSRNSYGIYNRYRT